MMRKVEAMDEFDEVSYPNPVMASDKYLFGCTNRSFSLSSTTLTFFEDRIASTVLHNIVYRAACDELRLSTLGPAKIKN